METDFQNLAQGGGFLNRWVKILDQNNASDKQKREVKGREENRRRGKRKEEKIRKKKRRDKKGREGKRGRIGNGG